jgi:hypothetical protein
MRDEFSSGRWRWYVIGAVPAALMVAALLPAVFAPFVLAGPLFTIFFYHVRAGRHGAAFFGVLFWLLYQYGLVALLVGLDPPFFAAAFAGSHDFGWTSAPAVTAAALATAGIDELTDFVFTLILGGVSGGALPLVPATAAINAAATVAGRLLYDHGFTGAAVSAAILSVRPWLVAGFVGRLMGVVGIGTLFYMKIERRPMTYKPFIQWLVLGFGFFLLNLYLQYYLGAVWEQAYRDAVARLGG